MCRVIVHLLFTAGQVYFLMTLPEQTNESRLYNKYREICPLNEYIIPLAWYNYVFSNYSHYGETAIHKDNRTGEYQ